MQSTDALHDSATWALHALDELAKQTSVLAHMAEHYGRAIRAATRAGNTTALRLLLQKTAERLRAQCEQIAVDMAVYETAVATSSEEQNDRPE